MLQHEADVNMRDSHGRTPLFTAIRLEDVPAVNALLDAGADVNASDMTLERPIHLACQVFNADIMLILMRRGADIDVQGCYGERPCTSQRNGPSFKARMCIMLTSY